jgi:hypothetical protein
VYKAAGRRSLGPAMAAYAALAYLLGDQADAAREMMGEIRAYKALDKSNWMRQDQAAFVTLTQYDELQQRDAVPEAIRAWSLLSLSIAMSIFMRCTLWMDDATAAQFAAMLEGIAPLCDADAKAKSLMSVAQMYAQREQPGPGLTACALGLALEAEAEVAAAAAVRGEQGHDVGATPAAAAAALSRSPLPAMTPHAAFGTVPMLHYLAAHMHAASGDLRRAEMSLEASVASTTKEMLLHHFLNFKSSRLRAMLGLQLAEAYERLTIPARKHALIAITLSRPTPIARSSELVDDKTGTEAVLPSAAAATAAAEPAGAVSAEWDWALEARDVEYAVRFVPAEHGAAPIEVVPTTRHLASNGPVEGRFTLPDSCAAGMLELSFSNTYSMLRTKMITYKLTLPDGVSSPTPQLV